MIFGEEMIEAILDGRKVETRRLHEPKVTPGRDYAVQPGGGKKQVTRIRVLSVEAEELGDIDHEGAQREGFDDLDAFFTYWHGLHGTLDLSKTVYVIRFELAELLSAKTKQRILEREFPQLIYPLPSQGPCPLRPGMDIDIARDVWITITRIRHRRKDRLAEYALNDHRDTYLTAGVPDPEHKTLSRLHHWTHEEEHGMTHSPTLARHGGRTLDAGAVLDDPTTYKQRREEAKNRKAEAMSTGHRLVERLRETIAELERDPEVAKVARSELHILNRRVRSLERKMEKIAA